MRDVLLVRHGKAVADAPGGDPARPLSSDGIRDIRAVAHALRVFGFLPDAVWHSPLVRTTQTAQLLAETLAPGRTLVPDATLTPEANATTAAQRLSEAKARCLLVVSHMPLLPALLFELTGARVEFGTGTVAHVRVFGLRSSALLGLWSAEHLSSVRENARG